MIPTPKYLKQIDLDRLKSIPIGFREICDSDRNFVLNSWQKGLYDPQFGYLEYAHYSTIINPFLHEIMGRAHVLVVYDTTDPISIYGWCCYEEWEDEIVIHWMYVKKTYRKLGIGKLIFSVVNPKELIPIVTFWSKLCPDLHKKYPMLHNPFFHTKLK
jgi:GNAT superfamily N-acetyltransferase